MIRYTSSLVLLAALSSTASDPERTKPGDIRWHPDFAAAKAAAAESGKPVLLFQLLGNLDETFC